MKAILLELGIKFRLLSRNVTVEIPLHGDGAWGPSSARESQALNVPFHDICFKILKSGQRVLAVVPFLTGSGVLST